MKCIKSFQSSQVMVNVISHVLNVTSGREVWDIIGLGSSTTSFISLDFMIWAGLSRQEIEKQNDDAFALLILTAKAPLIPLVLLPASLLVQLMLFPCQYSFPQTDIAIGYVKSLVNIQGIHPGKTFDKHLGIYPVVVLHVSYHFVAILRLSGQFLVFQHMSHQNEADCKTHL